MSDPNAAPMALCNEDEEKDMNLGLDVEVQESDDDSTTIKTVTLVPRSSFSESGDAKRQSLAKISGFRVCAERASIHSSYLNKVLHRTVQTPSSFEQASKSNIDISLREAGTFATPKATSLVAQYLQMNSKKREPLKAPLRECKLEDEVNCTESDMKIINQCNFTSDLTDLINLADYLDIESLFVLACGKVASLIRGQPKTVVAERLKPNYPLHGRALQMNRAE